MVSNPPTGTPRVVPYVYYEDAGIAVEWLAEAFGFTVQSVRRSPEGAVSHATLQIDDGLIFIGPGVERFGTRGVRGADDAVASSVHIYTNDLEQHRAVAEAAGATVSPVQEMPWGNGLYTARDLEASAGSSLSTCATSTSDRTLLVPPPPRETALDKNAGPTVPPASREAAPGRG